MLALAESQGAVRVATVTLFELTALHASGRIQLSRPPAQWIREALAGTGVRLAELSPDVAIDAGGIGRTSLADPIDRVLVATARQAGATLLTLDAQVLTYAARAGDLRARNARL